MGTAGIPGGWALQGYSAVGHYRDTWWSGTEGKLGVTPCSYAISKDYGRDAMHLTSGNTALCANREQAWRYAPKIHKNGAMPPQQAKARRYALREYGAVRSAIIADAALCAQRPATLRYA